MVEGDLKAIRVQEWKGIIQEREAWRNLVMVAKTLRELSMPEEKKIKKIYIYICVCARFYIIVQLYLENLVRKL